MSVRFQLVIDCADPAGLARFYGTLLDWKVESSSDDFSHARTLTVDHDWFKRAVFYEVLVRAFSDSNRDGTGDLRGLTRELNACLNGRGGGKPGFVQGNVRAKRAEIEAFWREKA